MASFPERINLKGNILREGIFILLYMQNFLYLHGFSPEIIIYGPRGRLKVYQKIVVILLPT
jgi:hypothetical protein